MGCGATSERREAGSPLEVDVSAEKQPRAANSPETTVVGTPVGSDMLAAPGLFKAVTGTPVNNMNSLASPRCGALRAIFADPASRPWLLYGVCSFLSWTERARVAPCVSRSLRDFVNLEDGHGHFWKWLCECLQRESLLHLPATEEDAKIYAGGDGNWQSLFSELWHLRHRFVRKDAVTSSGESSFRLAVSCRMRPARPAREQEKAGEAEAPSQNVAVTLPLHQRVTLLRQRRPELSHKEAMTIILRKERERKSGEAEEAGADEDDEAAAKDDGFTASVLSLTPGPSGSVLTVSPGIGIRSWDFDHVFCEGSTQQQCYQRGGLRLAMDLLNGVSGSLIVYGQTGSGKTHTMFGPPGARDVAAGPSGGCPAGLVPRIANEVLAGMEARRRAGLEVSLRASFIEVFGNDVSNLLGGAIGVNRAANQRMGHRYVLEGQCEEPVPDRETFASLLERGEENKRKASTAMNERSSRAHTLVILRLRQELPGQDAPVESRLFLVDLGGSERVTKSKANENLRAPPSAQKEGGREVGESWADYYKSRERITETNNINKGLLTLKRVIQALNARQQCAQEGKTLPRVPFADSKLTMLLEPALGGEARTAIVVCSSQENAHAEETVQSLRFGEMCRSVEHERKDLVHVNSAVADALAQIDAELREVEELIRKKERWEWREQTRVDFVDEMNTGGTECHKEEIMELGGAGAVEIKADDGTSKKRQVEITVRGQVLVGAEAENARRDELLKRREKLVAG